MAIGVEPEHKSIDYEFNKEAMGVKQTNRHKHASVEKVKEMTKEAKGTKRDTEFLFDEEDEVIAPRKGRKSTTTTGEPKKPRNMALAVQELQDKLAHMGDKLQENIQRLGHHAVCMQFMCSFFFQTHFVSRCCSHKESHKWRYSIETAAPRNACIAATINCTSG